jgi:short subunit dehydrogenase-like uncharacterized protein
MGDRVAVVGATGYTGGLVVAEFVGRGVEVVAIGRNAAKLGALPEDAERRVADVADTGALGAALDGCRAVVNCVGSFVEFGDAVVGAAVAAGVPYVDTTGEFPFLRHVFDAHDAPARSAGVAVVPGMAFYSAPADLVAALAAKALGGPVDAIEVGYRLVGARPSRGTLRTNLRRIGQPCPVWEDGRIVSRRIGDDPRTFSFPDPAGTANVARWPGGEILTIPRHTAARSVAVYLGMPKAAAAVLRNPRLTALLQATGRALLRQGTGGPSADARRRARFVIVARARAGGDEAVGVVGGHDLYGVTAAACTEAAQRLSGYAGPAPSGSAEPPAGALAPAEAFDPAAFLDALAPYLTWRIER